MNRAEKQASVARLTKAREETMAIVATGKCPTCGNGLRQNLSITGWWQCKQLGADTHRADPTRPSCNWQGFTA